MRNKKLILILLIAGVLRLLLLNKVPPSLNWDEISMGYTAYSIGETGMDEWGEKLPIFFRSYGEWKSAVYIYLLVPFIKFFGLNAWGVRLPSALAGITSVYLTYLITKRLFSKKAALWAALFLAISPWHIMLSRPAFEANTSLMLMLLGFYGLIRASHDKSLKYLIISAFSFGLAPHTYNSAKIIAPFLILWAVYKLKKKLKPSHLVTFFTILIIFAFPIVQSIREGKAQFRYTQVGITTDLTLTTQFYEFRETFPLPESINKVIFNRYTFFTYKLADNWLSYFSPSFLLAEGGDHNQHSIPYFGVLYITEFILILYGLQKLSKQSKHELKFLPIAIIILGFIPPATTRESHHVLRSILTLPGWQILAGVGAATMLPKISNQARRTLLTALFLQVIVFILAYFTWYPKAFARDWQYGHKEVIEYVKEHEGEYDQIIFTKWYGEPQLFLAFYTQWDPIDYQRLNKELIRYESEYKTWLDQLDEYRIGKYTFKYINWTEETKHQKTLFVGKNDDFWEDSAYLKSVYFPDGSVAFHIVEGDK